MRRFEITLLCGILISYLLPWQVYLLDWVGEGSGDPCPTRGEYVSGLRLCSELLRATVASVGRGRWFWDAPINAVFFLSHLLPLIIAAVATYRVVAGKRSGRFVSPAAAGLFVVPIANWALACHDPNLVFSGLAWAQGFPYHRGIWSAGPLLCLFTATAVAILWRRRLRLRAGGSPGALCEEQGFGPSVDAEEWRLARLPWRRPIFVGVIALVVAVDIVAIRVGLQGILVYFEPRPPSMLVDWGGAKLLAEIDLTKGDWLRHMALLRGPRETLYLRKVGGRDEEHMLVEAGRRVRTLFRGNARYTTSAVSPNGQYYAVGSGSVLKRNVSVSVYDIDGRKERELSVRWPPCWRVVGVRDDGSAIVNHRGPAHICEAEPCEIAFSVFDGRGQRAIKLPTSREFFWVHSWAISGDGATLAVSCGERQRGGSVTANAVRVFSLVSGE